MMAMSDCTTDIDGKQKRLKAVLAYDGIDEKKMHLHLAKLLQVSNSVAKRMLVGEHRTILKRGIDCCYALDVTVNWLYFGEISHYHNRTMRIHMQAYKGHPKAITDKAMRFHFAFIAGLTRAKNLMNFIVSNKMSYIEAVTVF